MGRTKRKIKVLATIWEVGDELWKIIREILDELDPPAGTGRPRTGQREGLNGIIQDNKQGQKSFHSSRSPSSLSPPSSRRQKLREAVSSKVTHRSGSVARIIARCCFHSRLPHAVSRRCGVIIGPCRAYAECICE
jgi:hypothetical protein